MLDFILAWCLVLISLCYTFLIAKSIPKGIKRLISIFPVFIIFFLIPFLISSVQLLSTTAFFISWLANFKLFLFAFGHGPLSSYPKPLPLSIFLAVSCFPIKIRSSSKSEPPNGESRDGPLTYTIMAALLALIIKVYDYSSKLPEKVVFTLYAFHMYFALELILVFTAALVRGISDLELEPQFNQPYLATSLQDFWGRRWNMMVSQILRPTVYKPLVQVFSNLGRNYSQILGVFGTFLVSGIMHELIFFYMGQLKPDWKIMWFFLINGFCTTVEIAIKKTINGRWRIPKAMGRVLTIGFVLVTALWLFLPAFERCKLAERALEEYAAISDGVAEMWRRMTTFISYILAILQCFRESPKETSI